MQRSVYVVSALVLIGALWHQPADAQVNGGNDAISAEMSTSDVFVFGTTTRIPAASSVLTRTGHSVAVTMNTRDLVAGHVYTVWWAIFAEPRFCAAIPCGLADLATPAVQATVAWATGRVSDDLGQATFTAHIVSGRPEGVVARGDAVFNPLTAEFHTVVRDHGEVGANGVRLIDQLTTLNAGCEGACPDIQASIHLP